jgi:predicted CopG family antitoxin
MTTPPTYKNVTAFLKLENYVRLCVLRGSMGERSFSSTINRLIEEKAKETEGDVSSSDKIVG